jgi:hypothetical protein
MDSRGQDPPRIPAKDALNGNINIQQPDPLNPQSWQPPLRLPRGEAQGSYDLEEAFVPLIRCQAEEILT